jgi:hypothetical protein
MQNNPPGPNDPAYIPQPPPPPPQYTQYPQTQYPPPPMMQPPPKKRRTWLWIIVGIVALIIFYQIGQAALSQTSTSTPPAATQAPAGNTPAATQAPAATPTPQPIHYPPTTEADLRGLAAKGDASAIHGFHSESVGLVGACPQPKLEVTVDPSVTGKQLAEDLLAYFYGQQLDSPCGSVVFAYHHQGEANDAYTAGRILFDVTDASGATNVDPNATNLMYTLTLDIGGFSTGKEYVVTY